MSEPVGEKNFTGAGSTEPLAATNVAEFTGQWEKIQAK